jgi:hypothetical protein
LLNSKEVINNDGQQLERQNFVKINPAKPGFGGKGGYKAAVRGAVFTNKIMAKKRNFVKF